MVFGFPFKRQARIAPPSIRRRPTPTLESLEVRTLLSTSTVVHASPSASARLVQPAVEGSWTILVYITGDNLNPDLARNVLQLENLAAQLPSSVKIVVFWSQPTKQYNEDGTPKFTSYPTADGAQAWSADTPTGMAVLQGQRHTIPASSKNLPPIHTRFNLSDEDSGDPATLEGFMLFARRVAPARHYALVLSDHGDGVNGFNFDDSFVPRNQLDLPKLTGVLTSMGEQGMHLADLAFDECLMASTEVEYGLRSLAPIIVASQEVIPGQGFAYDEALASLIRRPRRVTGLSLANDLVRSYEDNHQDSDNSDTLSAVNTRHLSAVAFGMRQIARDSTRLKAPGWHAVAVAGAYASSYQNDDRDLGQFLKALATDTPNRLIRRDAKFTLAALNRAVIAHTDDVRKSSGLSVVLVEHPNPVPADYAAKVPTYAAYTGWDQFLNRFLDNTPPLPPGEYRDPSEPNNTARFATPLGTIEPGTSQPDRYLTLPTLDVDWFKFQVTAPTSAADAISLVGPDVAQSDAKISLFVTGPSSDRNPSVHPITSSQGAFLNLAAVTLVPGRDYYLAVDHRLNGVGFLYGLQFQLGNSPSPTPVDFPAGNRSPETAQDLGTVIQSRYAAVEVAGKDVQVFSSTNSSLFAWYTFATPRSAEPLSGSIIVYGDDDHPLSLTLYDAEGLQVASTEGQSSVELRYQTDGGAEPFTFAVGGASGPYRIFFKTSN